MISLDIVDNFLFLNKADRAFVIKALKCGATIIFNKNALYFEHSNTPICFVRKINF